MKAGQLRGLDEGLRIPRRASANHAGTQPESRLLAEWRDLDAYVLLGDPGSGKSASLLAEADATGGCFLSARDFIALGVDAEDHDKTLFIDGLDEMRAGTSDAHAALDAIRAKLKALGRPRFRLSCREYDWRSQSDLADLSTVAPGGVVFELHLEPLIRDEQHRLLLARNDQVGDADAFLRRARQDGLDVLFGNPLLLNLTVRAVAAKGSWPDSRRAIYDMACRSLASEHSDRHRVLKPLQPGDLDRLLDDAGLMCALLLLSGKSALTHAQDGGTAAAPWHALPWQLSFHDATAALASKIFVTTAGESSPLHRSIAEYLAGRSIARRVQQEGQLPLGRVLALMQGGDGRIVEPLRGLLAWLATCDARDRAQLASLDPLAIVLNGDVAAFSVTDKRALLRALQNEATRNPWFRQRHWVSHPFAPLATADMADTLGEVLANHGPDDSHQALVDCVLDALNNSVAMPRLKVTLEAWVEDAGAWFGNRLNALRAWARGMPLDAQKARVWLDQLRHGQLSDQDARLTGELLGLLYPQHLGPEDVLRYWPREGDVSDNTIGPHFWYTGLVDQSRPQDFAVLADAWLRLKPQERRLHRDRDWQRLGSGILANALEQSGDHATDETLYAWLGIGIDEHGSSKLDSDAGGKRVAQWLTDRPLRAKAVVSMAWRATPSGPKTGRRYFWEGEQRLHRAQPPRDWLHWQLQQAADAPTEDLARYCFGWVARTVVDPPPGLDVPTAAQLESWVESHAERWPQAAQWLQDDWTSPLADNWQSEHHRRQRKYEAQALSNKAERQRSIAPQLEAVLAGVAPAWLMHQLAGAHEERFHDIRGETALQRVQAFLGSDEYTAQAAIAGIEQVLNRADLPSAAEVFVLDAKGKYHLLRPAALLAARLAHAHDPSVVRSWPDMLLSTLVAFWLTEGLGDRPDWYDGAAASRPELVAPLLVRHALQRLRRKGPLLINGLRALASERSHAALARMVLPKLLEGFPHRASEPARRELNRSLLAALHLLDDETATSIVGDKIGHVSVDVTQRISWMVAGLPYNASALQQLVELVGKSERRAVALGIALHEQRCLDRAFGRVSATTLARLIELLAPITKVVHPLGPAWVGPADERRDTVRVLIDRLAADPDPAAAAALQDLVGKPHLEPWHGRLRHSVISQQSVAREVHYVHPSAQAVALTLANSAPANRADLLALTLDHLQDIERHLRGVDTFELKLFWTIHQNGETVPKQENECRDLVLRLLRDRFRPLGIHVVPERLAADDKRADLRIECTVDGQQLALPIEIKKEDNRSLWLAWRDQLQALYSNDPAADGHGIYLVLWFGHRPRPSPNGLSAINAAVLQQTLANLVPEEERARLAVKVIDLSQAV